MREETLQILRSINKEFYQRFGEAFAETRRRIQPGVARVLDEWVTGGDWLDIGCGSGTLSQAWIKRGLTGSYTGIDFSQPLLHEAQKLLQATPPRQGLTITFRQMDLMNEGWAESCKTAAFDGVLAFAVLHHIPGAEARMSLLQQATTLVKPGGLFIHSEWQFQHSPKLMARVQPWSKVNLSDEDVDAGDTLLDWRHEVTGREKGYGLRYVHLFSREELQSMAEACGFEIVQEYESDGAGERLGLYQIWRKLTKI